MDDQNPLHAVINRVLDRRRQWLMQQGVSLDSWVIEGGLQSVLAHLTRQQKSKISQDQLKLTWDNFDKEASEEITKILAQQPHIISIKDEVGNTPLRLAVNSGSTAIAEVLLDHGANMLSKEDNDGNMLHVAAKSGNTEMVLALLDRAADVTAKDDYGSTVLHVAVRSGNVDMVKRLLDKNAELTAQEEDGSTALHVAVSSGNPDMVELLLERGADKEAVEEDGRTPLHVAACYKNTHVVKALLKKGAIVTVVNKGDKTPLHFAACYSNTKMIKLLLDQNAPIDAKDNVGNNPLSHMIASQQHDIDDESIAIAHLLCLQGSVPNESESFHSSLKKHQLGLLAIAQHWHQYYLDGKPLMNVQSEVIKGGTTAVNAYLDALEETTAGQLVRRCKVCVVGPSKWGKTSLAKSLSEAAPSIVDEEDRTIGIELFSLTFPPNESLSNEAGDTKREALNNERHDVTFWDFAGQDIYQSAHVVFLSKRTLYVVCIDLPVYVEKLGEMHQFSGLESENFMQRFFEEKVLRWIRLILLRQPGAYFKLIGTKSDEVLEPSEVKHVEIDVSNRLIAFVEDVGRLVAISDENALQKNFDEGLLITSSNSKESLENARVSIRETICANPEVTFNMPTKYTLVLEHIVTERRIAKNATHKDRLKRVIVLVNGLCKDLRHKVDCLTATDCRGILRTLHELGEVMWYEDCEFKQWIILDPTIILDLVRDVVNHEYEGKDDERYKLLRQNGTLQHSLLMTFPFWNALSAVDSEMVHRFKHLLKRFNLAYPVSNETSINDSDMIVPTYWKIKEKAHNYPLSRHISVLERNFVVGSSAAKWKYSIPVGISETIFGNFVVQSHRSYVHREIKKNYFDCFIYGEFGARIYFITNDTSLCDDITIEVTAGTKDLVWAEMRYLVVAMEQVLSDYPGLTSTGSDVIKRYIIEDQGDHTQDHEVNYLLENIQPENQLRGKNSWFPPEFKWFIQRAWTIPGKMDELQLSYELTVLKRLIVDSDKRKFPAVWTISYPPNSSTIELRVHSDLSGKCYHPEPFTISLQGGFADFVAKHSTFIQVGISVLSLATVYIPYAVVGKATELALSSAKDWIDNTNTVKTILDRSHLNPGESKSSQDMAMSSKAQMGFLRELFELSDKSFNDFSVGDRTNLCCTTTKDGSYVWVHSSELQKLEDHLTPCVGISFRIISVDGLPQSRKKFYCEWEIVYNTDTTPIAKGKTEKAVLTSAASRLWASSTWKLDCVDTVEMLRKCSLKLCVYQSRHFRKDKEIGRGEQDIKNYVQPLLDCSKTLEIPILLSPPTATVSPPLTVCRVLVNLELVPIGTTQSSSDNSVRVGSTTTELTKLDQIEDRNEDPDITKLDKFEEEKHELTILNKLMVGGEKREFPAVWTLFFSEESSTIELRIHSDISGKCYHQPLLMSNSNSFTQFVADNADFIQIGISVLVVSSLAESTDMTTTAAELALSAASSRADDAQSVKRILDNSRIIPPDEAKQFLHRLLRELDTPLDEFTVGEAGCLCRAIAKTGSHVWVHPSELHKLGEHLTEAKLISNKMDSSEQDRISKEDANCPECDWLIVDTNDQFCRRCGYFLITDAVSA